MKLHTLKPAQGSVSSRRRIGRGPGSGLGGTSTRGQMPLQRRLPKFGFKNINRVEYVPVNLGTIQKLAEAKNLDKITLDVLVQAGYVSSKQLVKILGNGELTKKVDVEAHAFSKSAEAAITALGGVATKL